MVQRPRKTALSRPLKMRMFLMLVFFGCFECIAANSSKVSETGTTKDSSNISNSTHQSNPTVRNSRALAQFAYSEFGKNKGQTNDQTPKSESKSLYIIPHMRPGRSEQKRNNDLLIPTLRFGRSDSSLIPTLRFGRSDSSLIPTLRFGRSDSSLIPTPRLGRSSENVEESGSFIYPENDDVSILDGEDEMASLLYSETSNMEDVGKREDSDNIIPYPRLGRSDEDASEEGESKRESNDSLIPQIRYGRDSSEIDLPKHFLLPNMRPGRSSKVAGDEKDEKTIPYRLLPYPRPGRMTDDSDGFTIKELIDAVFTSSGELKKQDVEELTGLEDNDLMFLEFPKDELDKSEEQFVIPYPRPGKRSFDKYDKEGKSNGHLFKLKSKESVSDYVLPYPRPGKRESSNESESPISENIMDGDSWKYYTGEEDLLSAKRGQSGNIVPYPRPGRSSNDNLIPQLRFGRSDSILPYPRLGRSNSIVPNIRFGRSDSILPNLRFGRSDSVIPNMRYGRSDSILPNLRFGRSNSVIPNIRFGRSDSIIPNLRFGRSDSVIPNIRFGRSDSILPNLRFGRSNVMLPYPRPGRSKDIIPYPRLGRSESIVPYPRPGRSNSILPYPRLGRSGTVLPYPRLGRSKDLHTHESVSSSDLSDETDIDFPYKSMEDYINSKEKNEHVSSKEKPNPSKKETEHVLFDSVYLLPYPRPGRKA